MLTPSIGLCVMPFTDTGCGRPAASRIVGRMSMTWWNWWRMPPASLIRAGHDMALLHALGGLANNHFLHIRDFLEHPLLRGGYTHLMPHYLFAVLVEKVLVLRRLSQERLGLRGPAEPTALG